MKLKWSKSALQHWEEFSFAVRVSLRDSEADPEEVLQDLLLHAEEDLRAEAVVTADHVDAFVARANFPGAHLPKARNAIERSTEGPNPRPPQAARTEPPRTNKTSRRKSATGGFLTWGLILPLGALVVEESSGICADHFFDPLPTPWHILLFMTIPFAIVLSQLACERRWTEALPQIGLLHGVALVVAAVYTVVFMRILPFSLIGILFLGIGLCGLAPLVSMLALLSRNWGLRVLAGGGRIPSLRAGFALGVALIAIVEVPAVATRAGLEFATSENESTRERALAFLKTAHHERTLRRACYQRPSSESAVLEAILPFGDDVAPSDARRIYYQATGAAFDSMPAPRRRGSRALLDFDQGGEEVSGKLQGLALGASSIDGSIDPHAGLAYAEWTLVLKNTSRFARGEARAEVLLPPGSVVSRLTLWVNDEPREAVFGSRSRVRAAYEAVVRQQRDPVLITTAGPDRILIQCFPVPPEGEMKVRFGITSPLSFPGAAEMVLPLPRFTSRNFDVPESVEHHVWFEAKGPLRSAGTSLRAEHPKPGLFAVRGTLSDADLNAPEHAILIDAGERLDRSWSTDPGDPDRAILQTLGDFDTDRPDRLVLVIDTSATMAAVVPSLADALDTIPRSIETTVLAAGSEPRVLDRNDLSREFERLDVRGGVDNIPALIRAWDLAAAEERSVILWIHGPLPVTLSSPEPLVQRWRRRPEGPRLIDVPAVLTGRNLVLDSIDSIPGLRTLPRTGAIERDLTRLFDQWAGVAPARRFERRPVSLEGLDPARKTSEHLARLYIHEQVEALLKEDADHEATLLASRYRLVTPVTGAVVLETDEEYERAGISPTSEQRIPSIPEPEMWALLALAAVAILFAAARRSA